MQGCSLDKNCNEALGKTGVRMTCAIDQRFPNLARAASPCDAAAAEPCLHKLVIYLYNTKASNPDVG